MFGLNLVRKAFARLAAAVENFASTWEEANSKARASLCQEDEPALRIVSAGSEPEAEDKPRGRKKAE
jgi:hypothetical protein